MHGYIPPLCCGVMIAVLRMGGILLVSRHFFQNVVSGVVIDDLHLTRRIVGKSSGPDANVIESLVIACLNHSH